MRRSIRRLIVFALMAGLLALFLRNADFGMVWLELRHGRIGLLLLALVTTTLTYVMRALRWQYLLAPIGRTHFTTAFRTTVIGFATSFLLPARAGEFIRPYLLAKREGLSVTSAFATIVVERLFDLLAVLVYLGAFLWFFDPGLDAVDRRVFRAVRAGGASAAVAALVAVVLMMWLASHPGALSSISRLIDRTLPDRFARRARQLVVLFTQGLGVMREPRRVLVSLALSLPLWLSIAAGIWLTAVAFHIDVPPTGAFLLMALLVVGVAVPTPGSVGGFHEAFRIGATAFYAAPNDRAISAGIVLHAISFLPVTIAGIVFMAQDGLTLGRMRELSTIGRTEDQA